MTSTVSGPPIIKSSNFPGGSILQVTVLQRQFLSLVPSLIDIWCFSFVSAAQAQDVDRKGTSLNCSACRLIHVTIGLVHSLHISTGPQQYL